MTTSPQEPLPSQPEERRFVLKLAVLLVATVLALLAFLAIRGGTETSPFPRVKLPDGSWLIVRAVTVGTSHSIELPLPPWERIKRWRQSYTQSLTTPGNRMAIWLTREGVHGDTLDLEWFSRAEIVLSEAVVISAVAHHREHQLLNATSSSSNDHQGFYDVPTVTASSVTHTVAVARCEFPVVRPRDGLLRLNVYDGSQSVVAILDIPYPVLPNEPTDDWQVDPLPVTRSSGNLDVTLKQIVFSQMGKGRRRVQHVVPQFEFVHDGQPSQMWLSNNDVFDPLGNHASGRRINLSPLERVWKLRLTLTQKSGGRFTPEEIGELPPLPLAPAKQMVATSTTHTINGETIQLIGLGGTGPLNFALPNSNLTVTSKEYQPGERMNGFGWGCEGAACVFRLNSGHPFLMTTDSFSRNGSSVELRASDQDGETLAVFDRSSSNKVTFWFFEPKPTSTSITFQFLVQQPRQVEFFIAPPKPGGIPDDKE